MIRPVAAYLAAALVLSSCAGGSTTLPGSGVSGTQGPSTAAAGATLGGVMNVASLTIPAGQTNAVTSSLTVLSTGSIEIDGTLAVSPGVRVALFAAGSITINGKLKSTQSTTRGAQRRQGHVAGRRRILQAQSAVTHILDAPKITWNSSGTTSFNAGDSVEMVTPDTSGTITINGDLTLAAGADGSDPAAAPGSANGAVAGGSIEIGTAAAISDAAAFGRTAAMPAFLDFNNAQLEAGAGGNGADDLNGSGPPGGATIAMHGGTGAPGGSVDLAAAAISIITGSGFAIGGNGGNGGANGFDENGNTFFFKVDEGAVGGTGENISARTGDGGNGGNVTQVGGGTGLNANAGAGGSGGDFADAHAGKGGPGGDGGATTIAVGNSGANGTARSAPLASTPPAHIDVASGGSGGDSTTASLPGGKGGKISIASPTGGVATNAVVTISNYANGGNGFNGCAANPNVAGTAGGDGGSLTIEGTRYTAVGSFNAGNGGSGTSGGVGGTGGKDDAGVKLGTDGAGAATCAPATPVAVITLQPLSECSTANHIYSCALTFPGDAATVQVQQTSMVLPAVYTTRLSCSNPGNFTLGTLANNFQNSSQGLFTATVVAHGTCNWIVTGTGNQSITIALSF